MDRLPSYVEYFVYFDLKIEEIAEKQNNENNKLKYYYNCVYEFIEKTHSEREEFTDENGDIKKRNVDYYSMVIIVSRFPLRKENIVAILDLIPNGESKRKRR